jgi:outer membrane protein assembly factor BamA
MQPLTGFNGKLNTTSFLENLGNTSNYTNINLQYNRYFKQGERNTIALRFYAQAAVGDVPFAAQNVVGRDDLRGYSNGKYRANQVYDVQTEYRHWFREKWGYVAFGGVATAINNANDISLNKTLPAVGAGIRFLAVPKARISVGVDVAAGKDDWGVYFRIGEAFGR